MVVNEWLVRTSQNFLAGPYTQEQVVQLIREGRLNLQDEICQANGFWVFLHERDEVRRVLGIDLPRTLGPGGEEEITETQTENPVAATGTDGAAPANAGSYEDQTSVMATTVMQSLKANKKKKGASSGDSASPSGSHPTRLPRVGSGTPPGGIKAPLGSIPSSGARPTAQVYVGHKPQFLKGIVWLVLAIGLVVAAAVLQFLNP